MYYDQNCNLGINEDMRTPNFMIFVKKKSAFLEGKVCTSITRATVTNSNIIILFLASICVYKVCVHFFLISET
jgi:hypothetical protein